MVGQEQIKHVISENIATIFPCYNEEKRLDIKAFEQFASDPDNQTIDIILVNDGSNDGTLEVIKQLSESYSTIDYINLDKNMGKAEAIRKGVLKTIEKKNYDYIGYFDADLATPIEEINAFGKYLKFNPKIVLGSRISILGQNEIRRKISRHYIGRVFATIVSNMLHLSIYDTQCGAKLIRTDIAKVIFQNKFSSRWLFDIELLFRAKRLLKKEKHELIEHPVSSWEDKDGSKIKMSYYLKAPLDLIRIYLKYK